MAAHKHREATGHNVWTEQVSRSVAKNTELSEKLPVKNVMPAVPPPQTPEDKRISRRAMCLGNVKHRSAPAAQLAIDTCPFDKEFLNVYRGLYCGKWYVGHIIKAGSISRS